MGNSMKKITLLLVITFTFLFSTTSWGEWSFVVEGVDGHKHYYDKDRVRKNGKYLYLWDVVDFLKPDKWGDLSTTRYIQLDCSILRYKFLKLNRYNDSMGEGKQTDSSTPKGELGEWLYPSPKSVGEILYDKVCEEHQKNYVSLEVKKRGVFYYGMRDGKFGNYTEKWEGLETEENMDYGKYEGETKDDIPNGQGTFTYTNGKKYVGEYKDGNFHGQGTITYTDGTKYVGEWKDDIPNGQGTFTYTDGTKYVGEWKDGKKNGQGRLTTSIGNYYEGEWKDGEMWNGKTSDKDGKFIVKVVNGEQTK
jgi:hypothetical protein